MDTIIEQKLLDVGYKKSFDIPSLKSVCGNEFVTLAHLDLWKAENHKKMYKADRPIEEFYANVILFLNGK